MPKVDMDMTSGRIVSWHVAEGAEVTAGDPLFDIETDKAAMEVESPASGVLQHVRAAEGDDVTIGQPVGWIYAEDEDVGAVPDASRPEEGQATPSRPSEEVPRPRSPEETQKIRATPRARKLAREAGVALGDIEGSALRGRVQHADVAGVLDRVRADPVSGSLPVIRSGGDEGVPLVLIHGFASDASSWAGLLRFLPKDVPIYRMELPAHGKSPARPASSFQDLVRLVRQAFDLLDLKAAHLVGHSLGGALALALADTRPRQVSRLTLLSPAGLGPEINGKTIAGITRAKRAESLAPWLKTLVATPEIITDNYVQAAWSQRGAPGLRDAQRDLAAALFPDGTQSFDLRAALDRITVPARIIWGREDRIIPWRHALGAPGAVSLNLFERTGHLSHIERAEEVAVLIGQ